MTLSMAYLTNVRRKVTAQSILLRSILLAALILVSAFSTLAAPFAAKAQVSSQVVLNFSEVEESQDQKGLQLRAYFTVTDNLKKPLTNLSIKEATLTLDPEDGGNYKAKTESARGPISLVLVLDTSGSMFNTFKKMLAAASDLVKGLPQGSKVAIIQFNTQVNVVQNFTASPDEAIDTINKMKAGGTTCLFDATYRGVELLSTSGVSGRRAVVVFTDGVDENGAGKPCSQKKTNDIAGLATDRKFRVPIFSIGLRGSQPIAEADLRNISEATGGTVAIGNDVTELFKSIVDALNAQYMATATIFPRQGDHNATLNLILSDGSIPNADSTIFSSPKDYSIKPTPTPLPVVANLTTVKPDGADLILSVQTQSAEFIKRYKVEFIDNKTNLLQKDFTFNVPPLDTIRVPGGQLPSGEYNIVLTPLDDKGTALVAKPSTLRFQYTVPTPVPTVGITATPEPQDFMSRLGRAAGDPSRGPIVFGVILIVVIGLLITLAALFIRRPKQAATGTGFLREMTGAVDVHQLAGYTPSWSKGGESSTPSSPSASQPQSSSASGAEAERPTRRDVEPLRSGGEATGQITGPQPVRFGQATDATNIMPAFDMPRATLTVTTTRDQLSQGKLTAITHTPFTLGRTGRDLNFEGDSSVSRDHAAITYENGMFYLTDKGSTNKSRVDGKELPANTPTPLQNGTEIQLGSGTKLLFQLDAPQKMDGTMVEQIR